ncbi:MAG: twin-arginine translocation signal domain-containing protein [Faecalibacterium prausnitzii]
MSKAISRRNFLMATGAVGAAGLLAACGSKPAASSTASSAAASQAPPLPQRRVWPCLTAPST